MCDALSNIAESYGFNIMCSAGLKGGVNDEVCQDWGSLNATNGAEPSTNFPVLVNDRDKALLYPFFYKVRT